MQLVLVTCGMPGIGKSTWAEAQKLPIVSPDRERARLGDAADQRLNGAAWHRVRERIEQAVFTGNPPALIVDGTFAGRSDRKSMLRTIGPTARRVLVVFPVDRAAAHRQNAARGRLVPAPVVDRFADKLEESLPRVWTEGWDLVWDVLAGAPWGEQPWTPKLAAHAAACGWPAPPR